ncbi:MAG: hypothetical protein Q9191_001210 [Dirinaria sp. TL-2023a]
MLGVIMSRNACVALDTTHPDARLQSIIRQIEPKIMLSSRTSHARASMLARIPIMLVDDSVLVATNDDMHQYLDHQLPIISPADIAYISFTSGTTGTPKGACMSHANVRSAIHHQGQSLGFSSQSRVFDFAPYSFDVAWSNFLHTAGAGGCLCIAEQGQMLDDVSAAILSFKATLVNVTPTILRTIEPIPESLETVLLSGEMPFRENIVRWAGHVRLLNTYGPTECTFKSAFSVLKPGNENDRPNIGVGIGCCTWLVDPHDSTKLADLGAVGELYLEGPLVGQGYFKDPIMTASTFVKDPPWLRSGESTLTDRSGRLYKTGDLARYVKGGRLVFVGRNDETQLKIRGQRIELGDIEHHVRTCIVQDLPIIVDVIRPMGSKEPCLTLFVQTCGQDLEAIQGHVKGLTEKLSQILPQFMIPGLVVPIERIPIGSTGKADRRQLRDWGSGLSWAEAIKLQSILVPLQVYLEPTNELERHLREIWARVLNLEPTLISVADNLFQTGGDSVTAIQMVASARKENILITVADIFRNPRLIDLATVARMSETPTHDTIIAPFSLLASERNDGRLCRAAADLCEVDVSDIEDMYPCTPLQEGMLAITAKTAGDYVARKVFQLPQHVDQIKFQDAWNKRLVPWRVYLDVKSYLEDDDPITMGTPLCRAGLIKHRHWLFFLDIHHAIFDGWSIKLILDAMEQVYHECRPADLHLAPFTPFVKHILTRENADAVDFWQNQLAGPAASIFPLPNRGVRESKKNFSCQMPDLQWSRTRFTASNLIRTAIAILLASYTNSTNVIFGAVTSGRQASLHDIDLMVGPTIATTPVRIELDWNNHVDQFREQIQNQAVNIAEHEQFGLQNIRRISTFLRDASEFQLLLTVQPKYDPSHSSRSDLFARPVSISGGGELEVGVEDVGVFNPYAMSVICQVEGEGLSLDINYDPAAISEQHIRRFAWQLEHILQQICHKDCGTLYLHELSLASQNDLSSMWQWNKCVPEMFVKPIVDSLDEHAIRRPDSPAISAWDKNASYGQLKALSCGLAHLLRQKGVGMGTVVVLSFERSAWMAISMIATMRTGATVLPLSAVSSAQNAQEINAILQPKLAITSLEPEASAFYGLVAVIHINELVSSLDQVEFPYPTFSGMNDPSDGAIILFMSGSTGTPKAILWSHGTISTNTQAMVTNFNLTCESRIFQFSDYEYDVSNLETCATLSIGGYLCISTESDRLNRLATAINGTRANWMCLTPSVAEALAPFDTPSLETLVCAGEMLRESTARKWLNKVKFFHNWYGPAEAPVATSYLVREDTWKAGLIGHGSHALCWLVDSIHANKLAPVGAVAELYIEGPILAAGYVGRNARNVNEQAFSSPSWLQRGYDNIQGRNTRLYKTGDLAKYGENGQLIILGRSKDSERKLHGRRVDLGDIESSVQLAMSGKFEATVIAEIFSLAESASEILALFVKPASVTGKLVEEVYETVKQNLPVNDLEQTLSKSLPPYLIPKLYVPVASIPLTHTGKTDRRRLRRIGGSFTHAQLAAMQPSRHKSRPPSTQMERLLQCLWAEVIGIDSDAIFSGDSFLQLGADSIGAMQLVALAHDQGFSLTVADIFAFPQLSLMAKSGTDIDDYIREDESFCMGLATPLCRAAVISQHFILTIHHCLYDGKILQMILDDIEAQYVGRTATRITPFQNFIKHTTNFDQEKTAAFWHRELSKIEPVQFPTIPSPRYEPAANAELRHFISLDWPRNDMTPSTLIRCAWVILTAAHTSSDHIIFGATVSGRQADMKGIMYCGGPTISTVPIAIALDEDDDESVGELQARVQRQALAMTPFEQVGLRAIQSAIGSITKSLFQILLVVQPTAEGKSLNKDSFLFKARSQRFASNIGTRGTDPFNTYAMMLICELSNSGVSLTLSFDDRVTERIVAKRIANQFGEILRQMCMENVAKIKVNAVQTASSADIGFLRSQNVVYPEEPTTCLPSLIADMANERPSASAVDAHDGEFTFQQVEDLSTLLGRSLIELGCGQGAIVLLCLDKSCWTPIVQLAILKAGGICFLQAAQIIEQHAGSVLNSLDIPIALSLDKFHANLIAHCGIRSLTIQDLLSSEKVSGMAWRQLPILRLTDRAVLLLSSGTTGKPKRILWSHKTLAAAVMALGRSALLKERSRVFQFMAYNFDACTIESMATLAYGGCLCIPSESERLTAFAQTIRRFHCNFLIVTVSTAKLLQPADVSCVKTLGLCGEKLTEDNVSRWRDRCRVFNWYGPCEAATACFTDVDETWSDGVIGRSNSSASSRCWLVHPRNPDNLVALGGIGEIAVQGPACAECYLGDLDRTAKSFLKNPAFLCQALTSPASHESSVIYLTGDLARYKANGDMQILQRKDDLFKIRGNLISPETIEHHIHQCLSHERDIKVMVDIVIPESSKDQTLAAFLCFSQEHPMSPLDFEKLTINLGEKLSLLLPWHSVPRLYIPIDSLPLTPSGKRNRARLQEVGAAFKASKRSYGSRQEPEGIAERTLREIWSAVLQIDADCISANDSFLQRGDSITAMRLVGLARQQGLEITASDVFQNPRFSQMAKKLKVQDKPSREDFHPFELLDDSANFKYQCQLVASSCSISPLDVQDLFPCTPLQEGLLALSERHQAAYINRQVLELSPSVNVDHFRRTWERVVARTPILRTRIVDLPNQGLVQAVVKHKTSWLAAKDLEDYVEKDQKLPIALGSPLMRCGLFPDFSFSNNQDRRFIFALTMHHSIYDGVTNALILETLESLYNDRPSLPLWLFQSFVKYISNQDQDAETVFWTRQFESLEAPQFPSIPSTTFQPKPDSSATHKILNVAWRVDDFTPSTVMRAAWAILCSEYTSIRDVVFGTINIGRKAPVTGIERIAGPIICAVPIRVKIDAQEDCYSLLRGLQDQATEMIPYEQTGLSRIARMSEEASQACQFQSVLVVQPPEVGMGDSFLYASSRLTTGQSDRYNNFNVYALMLVCTMGEDNLDLQFSFDSRILDHATLHYMARQFERIFRRLCSEQIVDKISVSEISATTYFDLNQCWKWNSKVHATYERCMHEIIAEVAREQPDAIAVSAWDGDLTYDRLDGLSSHVACYLVDLGVERGTIVPLFFEKSKWMPITFLAVVKAGAAVWLVDVTLPLIRLKAMLAQVHPQLILTSVANAQFAAEFLIQTLIIGSGMDAVRDWKSGTGFPYHQRLPTVASTDLLYVIFTSGSTGNPKGCMIQHRNFSSAVAHQRHLLALSSSSRVYDYSSYAFDGSYWSAFHVLTNGGTLCIPSDEERSTALEESIHRRHATDIFLTPATARQLDPAKLPTLCSIYIGGEAVLKADVEPWLFHAKNTFIVYGPTECSAISLYFRLPSCRDLPNKLSIGNGQGVSTWIVNPQTGSDLSPIGAVGELCLEGPLVGQGYLGLDGLNALSFLTDPEWLLQGAPDGSVPGRPGRMYKTGDLVKYDPRNGTIFFLGRKDTQVKFRGKRIELSEIEHHVRSCMAENVKDGFAVAAEVIVPNVTRRQALVVFVQIEYGEDQLRFEQLADRLHVELPQRLPSFMVPSNYLSIVEIPLTAGKKIDRKRLQAIGASLSVAQLTTQAARSIKSDLTTEREVRLRQLWTSIFNVSREYINADTSFLRLGGDSISAMRLASLSRSQGTPLTVQHILSCPRLRDMAVGLAVDDVDRETSGAPVEPFSLLPRPKDVDAGRRHTAVELGVNVARIEDMFPCTGVQKELLSMTAKSPRDCIAIFNLELHDHVDIHRLQQAWEYVSRSKAPILRCRIVEILSQGGLVTVQVDEPIACNRSHDVDEYVQKISRETMAIAQPLTRLGFIEPAKDNKRHIKQRSCIFTQHHALYDGTSLQLLFEEVAKAYSQPPDCICREYKPPTATLQTFIKHVTTVDKEDKEKFWRRQCLGIEAVHFPALPHHGYVPKADSVCRRDIDNISFSKKDVTASTIIRAAWAILTAQYTAVDDVVFGALVTGRQAPIDGIEGIIAPLIAALPIRVMFDPQERLEKFLDKIHQQSVEMIPYEHTEFLEIRRINADTEQATRFNTLLVIQPPSIPKDPPDTDILSPFKSCIELSSSISSGLGNFNPHALMVTCQLSHDDNLGLELSFDSKVIDATQAERLASQMEHVLRQICVSESVLLRELDVASPEDMTELCKWNAQVPRAVKVSVQERIVQAVNLQPMAQAICAWDGSLTYRRLKELSDQLANHLIDIGVRNGDVLALCFPKSMWQPVAALGAIMAGATCVAMDVQQPQKRLRAICKQVGPKFVLASADTFELASNISNAEVTVVDARWFSGTACGSTANLHTPERKFAPSDVLYILFTSGSTGVLKGIVMTNEAFSSAVSHQGEALLVGRDSRVFDFVSYSFDITWSNLLNTLIRGGCLCIPSEWERMNDFAGAFNRLRANYIHFPPSVAASLTPATLPNLKTLVIGGEPLLNVEFSRWTHLVPIGAVGELLIEGPTLAREYLGDPDRTAAAFLNAPEWLRNGAPGYQGRSSKVYKTGDLLRYNSDGTLTFIGRKDGLIKLRGQRIELSEIECHVRSNLHDPSLCVAIAAEVIIPKNTESTVIAIFVKLVPTGEMINDLQAQLKLVFKGVENRLSEHLPRYMLPQAYVALEEMPFTGTNKINRRHLREIGNTYTPAMLAEMNLNEQGKDFQAPNTVMEAHLQALWSAILTIHPSSIGAGTNFFRIGGESIAAMRLVAAARQQRLSLSVADIFRHPRLCELAQVMSWITVEEGEEVLQPYQPFSLLPANTHTASFVTELVLPLLDPTVTGNVRDVLPISDFQTQAIKDNLQDPPGRWPHYIVELPPDVDLGRLRQACDMLVNHFDILQSVFVESGNNFLQVQMENVTAEFELFDTKNEEMGRFVSSLCDEDLRRNATWVLFSSVSWSYYMPYEGRN